MFYSFSRVRCLSYSAVLAFLLPCAVACDIAEKEVDQLQKEVDDLKSEDIASLEEQRAAIEASAESFHKIISDAETYRAAIEKEALALQEKADELEAGIASVRDGFAGRLDAVRADLVYRLELVESIIDKDLESINKSIAKLEETDKALSERIDSMKEYIDGELGSYRDWTAATFATLEQMAAAAKDVNAVKLAAESSKQAAQSLDSRLTSCIEAALKDIEKMKDGVGDEIKATMESLNASLSEAGERIRLAYETTLAASIAESEKSLMVWVGVRLESYYRTWEIQAKLDSLNLAMEVAIDEQKTVLVSHINSLGSTLELSIENNLVLVADLESRVETLEEAKKKEYDSLLYYASRINANSLLIKANSLAITGCEKDLSSMAKLVEDNRTALESNDSALDELMTRHGNAVGNAENLLAGYRVLLDSIKTNTGNIADQVKLIAANAAQIHRQAEAIAANARAAASLRDSLDAVSLRIEAAFKKAIADGIRESEGKADDAVAELEQQFKGDMDDISDRLDSMSSTLDELETDMAELEEDIEAMLEDLADIEAALEQLLARIQSVVYLPVYSEGVHVLECSEDGNAVLSMDFKILPSGCAEALAQNLSALGLYVNMPGYGADTIFSASAASASGNELTVGCVLSSLPAAALEDGASFNVALRISDGNNDRLSSFVKVAVSRKGGSL